MFSYHRENAGIFLGLGLRRKIGIGTRDSSRCLSEGICFAISKYWHPPRYSQQLTMIYCFP